MAAAVGSPFPAPLSKGPTSFMASSSSPVFSQASDKRFWSTLRIMVDTILPYRAVIQNSVGGSERAKGLKGDSFLFLRGFDSIDSDLCFMQEPCTLLEEENRRLRDGFSKGIQPEEDDLVRLQLEALLAEKSRLPNENPNLARENQCLHQLCGVPVYHPITSQDLSASYEEVLRGVCLDFSSPLVDMDGDS